MYDVGGLHIASTTPLAARQVGGPAQYCYRVGPPRPVDTGLPAGDIVAERVVGTRRQYVFCRAGEVVTARFGGLHDFEIDLGRCTVTSHAHLGTDPGLAPILLTGTIAAYLLTLGGALVLHASAVEVDGGALAFVGTSGQGKSTVAALCCASGYPLVTDDLLPLYDDGSSLLSCTPGGTELRLRPKVAELAERFDRPVSVYDTADRRRAVGPSTTEAERLPLLGVVMPSPGRGRTGVEVTTVPPGEAALLLTAFHRIDGWKDRGQLARTFRSVAQIVAGAPVQRMVVPWGPPFAGDLGRRIVRAALGDDAASDGDAGGFRR